MASRLAKMPTTSVRRCSSAVEVPLRFVRPDLAPLLLGEGAEGQHVCSCVSQHGGRVAELIVELGDDPGMLGPDLLAWGWGRMVRTKVATMAVPTWAPTSTNFA
jgi:hypothetical protein